MRACVRAFGEREQVGGTLRQKIGPSKHTRRKVFGKKERRSQLNTGVDAFVQMY